MRIIYFFLLAIYILNAVISKAEGGWNWQLGTNYALSDVCFIDSLRGWVAGDSGKILYTDNGGENWVEQETGTHVWLRGIFFDDFVHGWAVGDSGIVIHTSDGGNSWVLQNSDTNVTLWDVAFANKDRGWASGSSGVILNTTNRGVSWNIQRSGVINELLSISVVDTAHVWVSGCNEYLLYTKNGGKDWELVFVSDSVTTHAVFFLDSSRGWVTAMPFGIGNPIIFHTIDGGASWIEQATLPHISVSNIFFVDSLHGWVLAVNTIYNTTNGGNDWEVQYNVVGGFTNIHFPDLQHGWVTGFTPILPGENDGWVFTYREQTGIEENSFLLNSPKGMLLLQIYPNPFKREVRIYYKMPIPGFVSLKIYALSGGLIRTLVERYICHGFHNVFWDGKDNNGKEVKNGVYFCKFEISSFSCIKKIVFIK